MLRITCSNKEDAHIQHGYDYTSYVLWIFLRECYLELPQTVELMVIWKADELLIIIIIITRIIIIIIVVIVIIIIIIFIQNLLVEGCTTSFGHGFANCSEGTQNARHACL